MEKKIEKKILIVEDEKILSDMYSEKFASAGFKVILAREAREGLKLAKREKPDLIVLDILLPRENGIFFLEKLRRYREMASVPVLVFSNFDDPDTKKQAKKFGAKDYLIKTNYTPQQILGKIKKFLG